MTVPGVPSIHDGFASARQLELPLMAAESRNNGSHPDPSLSLFWPVEVRDSEDQPYLSSLP
jgi:hypothetical protein